MRRYPGVRLVAYDHPRWRRVGAWTCYIVTVFRQGRWYNDVCTGEFAWALECWKKECEYRKGKA